MFNVACRKETHTEGEKGRKRQGKPTSCLQEKHSGRGEQQIARTVEGEGFSTAEGGGK